MAVSIVKRPLGIILSQVTGSGQTTNQSGSLGINTPGHGLSTGDYVFVSSETEQYNGFWYVEVIDSNFFYIKEYSTAPRVTYINTFPNMLTFIKFSSTHGWSCVHLPIVYKLTNTAWPNNSIDTQRTETGTVNDNGYCKVTVNGDIKTTGSAAALDYVLIAGTTAVSGVHQIITWTSDTVFTLDIPYTAANDTLLSGAKMIYYYNNYTVRVRIEAGFTTHTFLALKPVSIIADLSLTPDSNNNIVININEYLKKKIKIVSNDLTLATLPNDIDSFCTFYIQYAETYDITDGSTITTSTPSFTSDYSTFEGVAVNSKLQFKNRYSGYMSEYLAHISSGTFLDPMKFLTLFNEPRYFIGSYYDISFLVRTSGYAVKVETYKNSILQATSTNNLPFYDLGLYRYELSLPPGSLEDRVDITLTLVEGAVISSSTITINVDSECSFQDIYLTWKNYLGGMDYWKFTAQKEYITDIEGTTETTENILPSWPNSYGEFADTIDRETSRTSRDKIVVRSQNMTESEMNAVRYIVSSPLVQIMVSRNDRRTVKVSTGSFTWKRDEDKQYSIEFEIAYTNLIPSQSL